MAECCLVQGSLEKAWTFWGPAVVHVIEGCRCVSCECQVFPRATGMRGEVGRVMVVDYRTRLETGWIGPLSMF